MRTCVCRKCELKCWVEFQELAERDEIGHENLSRERYRCFTVHAGVKSRGFRVSLG